MVTIAGAPLSTVSIAVAALILGNAVLIADMLPIINRFPGKRDPQRRLQALDLRSCIFAYPLFVRRKLTRPERVAAQ